MKASFRIVTIVILAGWILIPPSPRPLHSQERPPDNATAAQIEDGLEKARAGKLLDAIEQFQKVQDTAGDELVPVDRAHHAPARLVIQGLLAKLGTDGVILYRNRVDGQAVRRFEDAKKSRDDVALERLLTDMFAATATEDAILELAQRSFLRGDFDAAEHYWKMLLPTYAGDERILRFPSPKTDPATIQARLLMLKLFRGQREEVQAKFKDYRGKHPDASGTLAGKTGKYVDTLTFLLNNPNETTLAKPPELPGWPTFAGSASRLGNSRMRLPYFWPDVPAWKSPLPFMRGGRFDGPPPDGTHPRSLAFHPVMSDGRAYVADGTRVLAVDLMTGKISGAAWPKGGEDTRIPTRQDIRHSLTEHEGVLYARFGPSALKAGEGKSFILGLGARKGATEERDALWRLDPPVLADAMTHFEGAPLVHNDRLYVGLWRQAVGDAVAGVACYRIDDLKALPELVWQKWVGKAGSEPNGETRYRHALLSISGPNVVYCTDGGAVVALNANDGKAAWEYRYPRNERATMPRYRDLCPPLCDGGRIYAAPADTDRLLCLDAFTGQLIWDRDGIEVVHLLGVSRGRLIATIAGQVKGIRGFNLRTGSDSGELGWTIHDDGGEATFGRGLVTEEAIVWPTKHGLHFLNPADGSPLRSPIRGSFGNFCYADGVLLVTTATEIWGFVSEAKKLSDRRKAIEKDPENPTLHADLCQSLIDAGHYAEAEKTAAKAGEAKERLLWLLAERVLREGNKPEAKRIYEGLAKGDGSFAAAGAVRLAEMLEDKAKVRDAWRQVFTKQTTIRDQHGVPWPAKTYAEMQSRELLVMRGTSVRDEDDVGMVGASVIRSTPQPSSGLVRTAKTSSADPSRRILETSQSGIVASGERWLVFPGEVAVSVRGTPIAAALQDGYLAIASSTVITCKRVDEDRIRWKLDYQPNGPILSGVERPTLPAASGQDGPDEMTQIQLTSETASFVYDDRFLVKLVPLEGGGFVKPIPRQRDIGTHHELKNRNGLNVIHVDHGVEVDRFEGMRRAWKREPIFVGRELDDLAMSGEQFFTASDSTLTAYAWKNGERQWETPLPEASHTKWKITTSPQGLLVHPAEAIMTRTEFDAIGEFRKTGGQWNKLLQAVGKSYDVWTARELPILVIDPADGWLIQRLNFPALGPAAGVAVTPKGVVVVTGKGSWTLNGK